MNTTRIEVPCTLPEPHFEDEATIATARQVVPIERARRVEFWRKLRTVLPIFLAATFCGGLGAAAVNYYEHRHTATVTNVQASVSTESQTASSPAAVASSAEVVSGKETGSPTNTGGLQDSPATVRPTAKTDTGVQSVRMPDSAAESSVSSPGKKNNESDATKLTRKRRVHPPDEEPSGKKSGAGRITDVFTGPNP
jgi:hypothetical protein